MGIFSKESPFDQTVEKATHETNTKEDWGLILDICDRVGATTTGPKECLRSIMKRLNHQDPHVVIQALVLLDACISNCGTPFHLEIASRDFEQEYRRIIAKTTERTLRNRLLSSLEKWAQSEFKSDPKLDLIPSLYNKLKQEGFDFPSPDSPSKGKKTHGHHSHKSSKSHGTSSSAGASASQEEEDLKKAIELSLKEAQGSTQSKSLYPQGLGSMGSGSNGAASAKVNSEPRKVRALYDFEAAEDNELTFYAGEIVHVLDDSDQNWWQGSNQRGSGLFPANFVTADLSAEAPKFEVSGRKSVQFSDEVEVKTLEKEPEVVEIDESKIDKALHILHEADPTGEIPDPPELKQLEEQMQQMCPLIDQELDRIDRRHAQLSRLGVELVEALNMYHFLMREPAPAPAMGYNPGMCVPQMNPQHIPGQMPMGYPPMSNMPPQPPSSGPMPYYGSVQQPQQQPHPHPGNMQYGMVPQQPQIPIQGQVPPLMTPVPGAGIPMQNGIQSPPPISQQPGQPIASSQPYLTNVYNSHS